jgi:hypothetical protein
MAAPVKAVMASSAVYMCMNLGTYLRDSPGLVSRFQAHELL